MVKTDVIIQCIFVVVLLRLINHGYLYIRLLNNN